MPVDSSTIVVGENETPLIFIYRKYNSYPSIHGQQIFKILKEYAKKSFHIRTDMNNLAAYLVANLKKNDTDIFIKGSISPAFTYIIHKDKVVVKNYQGYVAFYGTWEEFEFFCTPDE
jgi:hypothetical protein